MVSPSRTATRFCCRQGPEVAWASARSDSPRWMRAAASPSRIRPAAMTGLAASAPPDGLTRDAVVEPERPAQHDLLGGERGMQLGGVDGPFEGPGALGGEPGRRGVGEVAHAEAVGLDAVVDAADPGRARRTERARCHRRRGPRLRRRRRRAGSRRCAAAGRRSRPAGTAPASCACGLSAAAVRLRAAIDGEGGLVGFARVDQRLGLECGERDGVGPERGDVVRVELAGEDVAHLTGRGLPVGVDEGGVGLAGLESSPMPRTAPRRRPSRHGTRRSAARRRRRRGPW